MQQTKYDYNALKLEYFKSEIDEIKSFRLDKGLTYSSRTREMTKWRWQEKQKRKDAIVEKALERQKNELAKKLEIPVEDLFKTKKQAIELMKYKLNQYTKRWTKRKKTATMTMFQSTWKILKKFERLQKWNCENRRLLQRMNEKQHLKQIDRWLQLSVRKKTTMKKKMTMNNRLFFYLDFLIRCIIIMRGFNNILMKWNVVQKLRKKLIWICWLRCFDWKDKHSSMNVGKRKLTCPMNYKLRFISKTN